MEVKMLMEEEQKTQQSGMSISECKAKREKWQT
jgi:hypothetical protein